MVYARGTRSIPLAIGRSTEARPSQVGTRTQAFYHKRRGTGWGAFVLAERRDAVPPDGALRARHAGEIALPACLDLAPSQSAPVLSLRSLGSRSGKHTR